MLDIPNPFSRPQVARKMPYSTARPTGNPNPPFVRQNPQRHLLYTHVDRSNVFVEPQDESSGSPQYKLRQPAAMFHGISLSKGSHTQPEGPRTPLNFCQSYPRFNDACSAG